LINLNKCIKGTTISKNKSIFSIEITTIIESEEHIPSGEAVFEWTGEVKTPRKTNHRPTMLLWWHIFPTHQKNENPERENKKLNIFTFKLQNLKKPRRENDVDVSSFMNKNQQRVFLLKLWCGFLGCL
jgi:hypothetical protein